MPSTPSRLIFAHPPSFFHHHLRPLHHKLPATTLKNPRASPSPLLRDVGSLNNASAPSEARLQPQPPLPFPKGCGRLGLAQGKKGGTTNAKGDPGGGRHGGYVAKTGYDKRRSPFFSHHLLPQPTPNGTKRRQRPPPTSSPPR